MSAEKKDVMCKAGNIRFDNTVKPVDNYKEYFRKSISAEEISKNVKDNGVSFCTSTPSSTADFPDNENTLYKNRTLRDEIMLRLIDNSNRSGHSELYVEADHILKYR